MLGKGQKTGRFGVPPGRIGVPMAAVALAATSVFAPAAPGTVVTERTVRLSTAPDGEDAAGHALRPAVSSDGRFVAFDSTAPDLAPDPNGTVRDVFLRDVVTGSTSMVSVSAGAGAANGPSEAPAVAGSRVAFTSAATNLVVGDSNGRRDVFVRDPGGSPVLVSVSTDGVRGNDHSEDADISAEGRFVAFTSSADNLVPNDRNGVQDVFVRDLLRGTTVRVSTLVWREANGPSRAPAISPDGRFVSFASSASNLARGDGNHKSDVFLADRETGEVERVSISSRGREQDRSVGPGFVQVSDVSTGGRYVVFDSDATTLVRRDRNRDTDVFVRDRVLNKTRRVSVSTGRRQGDNDSYHPTITPDGRLVAFTSFADNLAPGDAPGEDVFVRDRRLGATSVVSVTSEGRPRGPELMPHLLQRAALSSDGAVAAFVSTADNLVAGDRNRAPDVFMRVMAPPQASWLRRPPARTRRRRARYAVRADDPAAGAFLCRLDGRRSLCPASGRTRRLRRGRHVLRILAGGPGMLYESRGLERRFRVVRRR